MNLVNLFLVVLVQKFEVLPQILLEIVLAVSLLLFVLSLRIVRNFFFVIEMGSKEVVEKPIKLGFAELVMFGLLQVRILRRFFFDVLRPFHDLPHSVVKMCLSLEFTLELVIGSSIDDPLLHLVLCNFIQLTLELFNLFLKDLVLLLSHL